MNDTYVRYLEAKRDEVLAQVKLMTAQLYYKDSVIRRLRAEVEHVKSEHRQETIAHVHERLPDCCPSHGTGQ